MTKLLWDQTGERLYETGVDHAVLYLPNVSGVYDSGFAWNGMTTVTESPAGAEASAQYADNGVYLNLLSAETFGGTIEAFMYPDEFLQCDGTAAPTPGMTLGQQARKSFGLSYRTRLGNDTNGADFGYKLHLLYGALAAPSEKAFATINDSPEALSFSWGFTTTAVEVGTIAGVTYKPTSLVTVNSTTVDPAALADLESELYGGAAAGDSPNLPLPAAVVALLS